MPTSIDPSNVLLIKDQLAAILREEIISGKLLPGERIVEGQWAARLGVAQTSVREALNTLAAEGFVRKGSGRSAEVTQFSEEDIVQTYQVRAALEGLAARLLVENRGDLSDVEQALADMRSAAECHNVREFYERDLRFHMLICQKSGNRVLEHELRRLLVPLFAFVVMRVHGSGDNPEQWQRSIEQHRNVLEALRSGDPYFAENQAARTIQKFFAGTWELLQKDGVQR